MWIRCDRQMPPDNVVVDTKIDDGNGVGNVQHLIKIGNLWWTSDKKMYVYYRPTHWKRI
jgi:hypothetical protein